MSKKHILITDSQCINKAELDLEDGGVTILYGYNGLGKSSIGKALKYWLTPELRTKIDDLKPYNSIKTTNVSITPIEYEGVICFDKAYLDGLFAKGKAYSDKDAKEIYLSNKNLTEKRQVLIDLVADLQNAIDIQLFSDFEAIASTLKGSSGLVKDDESYTYNSASKAGKGFKLREGLEITSKNELNKYFGSLTDDSLFDKWLVWRNEAYQNAELNVLNNSGVCPYCGAPTDLTKQAEIFKAFNEAMEAYSKSTRKEAQEKGEILNQLAKPADKKFTKDLSNFQIALDDVSKSTISTICSYILKEVEKISELKNIVKKFDGKATLIENLKKDLIDKKLDAPYFSSIELKGYNQKDINDAVKKVNDKIEELLKNYADFEKAAKEYNEEVDKSIKDSVNEIDNFLTVSGIPYRFKAIKNEDTVATYLVPGIEDDKKAKELKDPNSHLSFGEHNSLGLALFGALARQDINNKKLVILDDPISSYDENKKQAVLHFLFNRVNGVLRNKTVLLLTHDIEPVIDMVKIHNVDSDFNKMQISAYLLSTHMESDGLGNFIKVVDKEKITSKSLTSSITLEYEACQNSDLSDLTRIAHFRRYLLVAEEYDDRIKGKTDNMLFSYTSSLLHLCEDPTRGGNILPSNDIATCEKIICDVCKYSSFDYYQIVKKYTDIDYLLSLYAKDGDYFTNLIILRILVDKVKNVDGSDRFLDNVTYNFLNEAYHVENLDLYGIRQNNTLPPYIINMCDSVYQQIFDDYQIIKTK